MFCYNKPGIVGQRAFSDSLMIFMNPTKMAIHVWLNAIVSVLIFLATTGRLLGKPATITGDDKTTVMRSDLPESVDLRRQFKAWKLLPKNQGHRNTCSVFTTTAAL